MKIKTYLNLKVSDISIIEMLGGWEEGDIYTNSRYLENKCEEPEPSP